MACNLVTNFEVALIKKLWQCSVLSRTLPSPPTLGGGERLHVGYQGIPAIFWLVCNAFVSITFAFSCYSRSVEARNCRSDRRETGTQIGQIGKTENRIGYQIRKPVSIFRENRKPNAKQRKIRKPAMNNKTEKLKFFWHKNRKTDLKNSQNRKTENPNAPHNRLFWKHENHSSGKNRRK